MPKYIIDITMSQRNKASHCMCHIHTVHYVLSNNIDEKITLQMGEKDCHTAHITVSQYGE